MKDPYQELINYIKNNEITEEDIVSTCKILKSITQSMQVSAETLKEPFYDLTNT